MSNRDSSEMLTIAVDVDMTDLDTMRDSLPNRSQNLPAVWCERCQIAHPVTTKEDYDEMIAKQVRAVTDAIDAHILERVIGTI